MHHRTLFSGLALVAALTTGATASAAEVTLEGNPVERAASPDAKFGLGADVGLVVPVGGWSDATGVGLGLLLRFEYALQDQLNLTGRLGYLDHFSKSVPGGSVGTAELPLLAGIKRFPMGDNEGFYLAPEVGLVNVTERTHFSNPDVSTSSSTLHIGATAGVGYTFGNLDLRASFVVADLGHLADTLGIMFNAGYTVLRF